MFFADGITLNGSEFETLRALAESDDPAAAANELLEEDGDNPSSRASSPTSS